MDVLAIIITVIELLIKIFGRKDTRENSVFSRFKIHHNLPKATI